MRRRCGQVAVILCLLVAMVAAAGYRLDPQRYPGVSVVIAGDCWELGTFKHSVQLRYSRQVHVIPGFRNVAAWTDRDPHRVSYLDSNGYSPGGFYEDHGHWEADGTQLRDSYWEVGVPLWLIVVLALMPPGITALLWRRKRDRAATGHCLVCGYDLRASPERCPECGTPVAAAIHPIE